MRQARHHWIRTNLQGVDRGAQGALSLVMRRILLPGNPRQWHKQSHKAQLNSAANLGDRRPLSGKQALKPESRLSNPLLTFKLTRAMATVQRLLPLTIKDRTHADWHQAVAQRREHGPRRCLVVRRLAATDRARHSAELATASLGTTLSAFLAHQPQLEPVPSESSRSSLLGGKTPRTSCEHSCGRPSGPGWS